MPTDDIDTMTGPELSAAVAREVMGWDRTAADGTPVRDDSGEDVFFEPHTDRNDAHRVLMRCEELGIEDDVLWELKRHRKGGWVQWTEWKLLTIDPAIVCRAALRAVRSAK